MNSSKQNEQLPSKNSNAFNLLLMFRKETSQPRWLFYTWKKIEEPDGKIKVRQEDTWRLLSKSTPAARERHWYVWLVAQLWIWLKVDSSAFVTLCKFHNYRFCSSFYRPVFGVIRARWVGLCLSATSFMSSDGAEGANWGLIGPLPPWAAEDSLSGTLGFTEAESSLMHAKTRLVCMCYSWIS